MRTIVSMSKQMCLLNGFFSIWIRQFILDRMSRIAIKRRSSVLFDWNSNLFFFLGIEKQSAWCWLKDNDWWRKEFSLEIQSKMCEELGVGGGRWCPDDTLFHSMILAMYFPLKTLSSFFLLGKKCACLAKCKAINIELEWKCDRLR